MKKYPILILHGWNLNASKYKFLEKELVKHGYKTLCFDLPGFGKSKALSYPFTLPIYAKYIINRLKRERISKIIIIGHSFGGRIGVYLSVNYPEMVEALILSGTPALGKDLTFKEKIYLFFAKVGKMFFNLPFLSLLGDFARKALYKMVGSYDYYKTRGVIRITFQNIVAYRLESFLPKIEVRTLIIWGEEDKIVPVKIAYGMKKLIKNSKLVIVPQARHGIPWTHTETFVSEVDRFLNSL